MSQVVKHTPDQAVWAGSSLHLQGKLDEAEHIFRSVLDLVPGHFEAMHRLGVLLADRKQFYEALYWLWRCLKVKRRDPWVLSNHAMVLGELGHCEEALGEYRRAAYSAPENPVIWNNMGNTLERMERFEEALAALDTCMRLDPKHRINLYNRGVVLKCMGRHREAIAAFGRALQVDPEYAEAHYNRGTSNLILGNYREGFADYEWRVKTTEHTYYVGPFEQPQWAGEPLAGRTILIHAEQGIGDEIQFLRYVPLVVSRGARVHLILHSSMLRLAASIQGATIAKPGDELPPFDYWSPLMSLPHVFGTTLDTIPPPYDFGIPRSREVHGFSVGLCWSGNWKHKNNAHRSISLNEFASVLVPGIMFHSLQKDVEEIDAATFAELALPEPLRAATDMQDTAEFIRSLDLVITVDTAVAHLAASLGVETWILIPQFKQDWRWLLGRKDSPWYPSVRLFRQPKVGDWASVLARVRSELTKRTTAQAA